MRLEVLCHNGISVTHELLDLLSGRDINFHGIEMVAAGRICFDIAMCDVECRQQLMADIRRIADVSAVRLVNLLPSEPQLQALNALFHALSEPVILVNLKGRLESANLAAQILFGIDEQNIGHHHAATLLHSFNCCRWLEGVPAKPVAQYVLTRGHEFLLQAHPFFTTDSGLTATLSGAVIILKSLSGAEPSLKPSPPTSIIHSEVAFDNLVAVSSSMQQVVAQARKLALLDAPLLIVGETGTGKDILARACHLSSKRGGKPFLALNCASLPDEVAESELFGHAAGAYPNAVESKKGFFEQAEGGSVLLDEIGEMSPRMQAKLLRFLNDGTFRRVGEEHEVCVDIRVICATQKKLPQLVQQGGFREDLFYRLNVLSLYLPPLRERTQDILPLTELFVSRFADEQAIPRPALSAQLNSFLTGYNWPGNVRQLQNVLYRALTQLGKDEVRPQDVILPEMFTETSSGSIGIEGTLDEIIRRFEHSVLAHLYISYPSTRKLAKRLGVSHTAIANKLREYGVHQKAPRKSQ